MDKHINSLWISDVHLGTSLCQHEQLYKFLKSFEMEDGHYKLKNLYLVGDILDIVQMNSKLLLSEHRKVIRKILRMADKGVNVVYAVGNHDYPISEMMLEDDSSLFDMSGITICRQTIHRGLDGRNYLVIHGDQFDGPIKGYPIVYFLGDVGYSLMTKLNAVQNYVRRKLKMAPWSFSLWIKQKVKGALQFINKFEELLVEEARKQGTDGVIAGHIHKAEDRFIDGVRYLNCGCWTEFRSAIVEYSDGEIRQIFIKEQP